MNNSAIKITLCALFSAFFSLLHSAPDKKFYRDYAKKALIRTIGQDSSSKENFNLKFKNNPFRPENNIQDVDIPKERLTSTYDLANYIMENYQSDTMRLWVLMDWISNNVRYDINLSGTQTNKSQKQLAEWTLKYKKGVCAHFEALFSFTAKHMGIESHSVLGYTRKNLHKRVGIHWLRDFGPYYDSKYPKWRKKFFPLTIKFSQDKRDRNGHIWSICKLGDNYHVFDPTWAAMVKHKYQARIETKSYDNVRYCILEMRRDNMVQYTEKISNESVSLTKDTTFIYRREKFYYFMCEDNKWHYMNLQPFDPIYRFQKKPYSNFRFDHLYERGYKKGKYTAERNIVLPDSAYRYALNCHYYKSEIEQDIDCLKRMNAEKGIGNTYVREYRQYLELKIDNHFYQEGEKMTAIALKSFNKAYSMSSGNNIKPENIPAIKQLISSCEADMRIANNHFRKMNSRGYKKSANRKIRGINRILHELDIIKKKI